MTGSLDRYGRIYATLAAPCLCPSLSFLPPFAFSNGVNATVGSIGSVWDVAGNSAGGPARAAVVALLVTVGALLVATRLPGVPPLPAVGVGATTIGALLRVRSATGQPAPDLSAAGNAQVAVAANVVAVAAVHPAHMYMRRGRTASGRGPALTNPCLSLARDRPLDLRPALTGSPVAAQVKGGVGRGAEQA